VGAGKVTTVVGQLEAETKEVVGGGLVGMMGEAVLRVMLASRIRPYDAYPLSAQ
jgi:hypothetical protein